MSGLQGLKPERFFHYFEELSRIPRGSGNEKAASDFIVGFAKDHGFAWEQDAAYNVKLWVPASAGYEHRKSLALQAHLDMVCASEAGVRFDFATQPIETYVEDGFVKARGTTLGADDGAGVAMILALLERADLPHPPLQAIFTTGEEILFVGAQAMDDRWIDSDYMIGLDYSSNKSILAAAAGMSVLNCACDLLRAPIRDLTAYTIVEVDLLGLQGGHSGNMIHRDRANAIKVMGEFVSAAKKAGLAELASLTGGTLINVIAYQAHADLACPREKADELLRFLEQQAENTKRAYRHAEPKMELALRKREPESGDSLIGSAQSERLLTFLDLCFAGAYRMADDTFSRAESSANLGILREANGRAEITFSLRSNVEYHHDRMIEQNLTLAKLCGLTGSLSSRFGAWEFVPESRLLAKVRELYREVNGTEAAVAQIHAGVEGGVFQEKARRQGRYVDLINIGCMNYDVHTPKERLEIASVQPTYDLLCKILENLE